MIFNLNEEEVMSNQFENVDLGQMFDLPEATTPNESKEVKEEKTKVEITQEDDGFLEIPDVTQKVEETDETEETDWTEVTDKTEIEEKDNPSKNKGSSSSSPFRPFAKALLEEGILSSFTDEEFTQLSEEFGGDAEALVELSRRTFQTELESYKKESEDEYKAFLEAREAGVDLDQWADIRERKKTYEAITDESITNDIELQKNLIKEVFRLKDLDEGSISDTIESYEDTGKLEKQAKAALKELKKYEDQREIHLKKETELNEQKQQQARKDNLAKLKKQIDDTTEIVPGMKLNKQIKDELFEGITKPVKTDTNGNPINLAMSKRMEDPIKYAIIENYLVKLGVFDGKFDKIMNKTKTTAITNLRKVLDESNNTGFTSGKNTLGKGKDDYDIDDKPMFGGL